MPVLRVIDLVVLDTPGNGYLDPGESTGLVTVLKNFGASAVGVTADLETGDPYVSVTQASGFFGDMAEGAVLDSMAQPFRLSASAGTPEGHAAVLELTAHFAGGMTTSAFTLCVGDFDYLVWEHSTDESSGPVLHCTLASQGYNGDLTTILPLRGLERYRALFVSCGMYSENFAINRSSPQALALLDYLAAGGGLYLEGGDVWCLDSLATGHDFGPAFGIASYDGGSGMLPLIGVDGVQGTFTQGMTFEYVGHNFHVDQLQSVGPAFTLLSDPYVQIDVGVARNDGMGASVGTSFEFAGLADGAPPSTKAELARALMGFLTAGGAQDLPDGGGADGPTEPAGPGVRLCEVRPNPWGGQATLQCALPRAGGIRADLFDSAGRCVASVVRKHLTAGNHALELSRGGLPAGTYWIRLQTGGEVIVGKCTIVR